MPVAALIALAAIVVVNFVVRPWIIDRYTSGAMTPRSAGWLYAAASIAPYALILTSLIFTDSEAAPIVLLLLALTLPVMIVPMVAMFRGPRGPFRPQ